MPSYPLTRLRMFRFLILPYMLFLSIFLILIIFFYSVTFSVLYEETAKNSEAILQRGVSTLDSRLEEIDNVISRISISRNIQQLKNINDPFHESNIALLIDAKADIDAAGYANAYLVEYFVFYFDKNLVIGKDVVHRYDHFLEGGLTMPGIPDLTDLQSQVYSKQLLAMTDLIYKDNKRGTVLPYVHTLPNTHKNNVVILMLISGDRIGELFSPIIDRDGSVVIHREGDGILFEAGTPRDFHQSREAAFSPFRDTRIPFISSSAVSQYKGYVVEALIPEDVVFSRVKRLKNRLLATASLLFTLGLIFAALIAFRRTKALSPVLSESLLIDNKEQGDVFQRIGNRISLISEDRERQAAMLRESFVRNLISGSLDDEGEARTILDGLGLKLSGDFHFALLIRFTHPKIEGRGEFSLEEEIPPLAKYLENALGASSNFRTDSFQGLIILSCRGNPSEEEAKCQRAIGDYPSASAFILHSVMMGIGQSCTRLLDIPQSYREAQRVIETRVLHDEISTLAYRFLKPDSCRFSYPLATEQNLINLTLACHKEEALELFDRLTGENMDLSSGKDQLLRSLRGTLLRITALAFPNEDRERDRFDDRLLSRERSGHAEVDLQRSLLVDVLDALALSKESKTEKLIGLTREFIEEHFTDPGFGIPSISERFSISEFHFSREFKRVTGIGFNVYLEDLRLNRAKKHLQQGKLSIKQIAAYCGYHSSNTFCRAFKRRNGITPGDYKAIKR